VTTYNESLFPYNHDVIYSCADGHRFEDGHSTTSVMCSITGWAWNQFVTSCGRMLAFPRVVNARCYASAVYAVSVCLSVRLSVRLSHAGILPKRLNVDHANNAI